MEQKPKEGMTYKVCWHHDVIDDLKKIHPSVVEGIVEASEYRLSQAPELIGHPLKGTTNRVWKMRFSNYRILYTINVQSREVWILCVCHRKSVYNEQNLMSVLKMAIAIHQSGGSIKPNE